jgi:predicted dinucleotide-binding enzyme
MNTLSYIMVEQEAHRDDPLIGVPVAGNDPEAVATAASLVRDAGFEPVIVGGLDRARSFDRGTEVYVTGMTAVEIRQALGLRGGSGPDPAASAT